MMKSCSSLVTALAITLSACVHYGRPANVQYYFKSKTQLRATERDALLGDNPSARRMADYYYFAGNDQGLCIWWLKLAASRGDSVARDNLRQLQQD
jgi:TPR repeat protein